MCIITYKAKGVDIPSADIIKTCFKNNPDGAGVAILRPGAKTVEIHKGFMELAGFYDFVSSAISAKDIAVYHYRITTSGGTKPQNCHPFPISDKVEELQALSIAARYAFVHNGIIGQGTPELSDTQIYIKNTLAKLNIQALTKGLENKITKETEGSRTLTIDARYHKVIKTGTWVEDEESGLLFSNRTYVTTNSYDAYYDRLFNDLPFEDQCPNCQALDAELISDHYGLYECPYCNCLFDDKGSVWALGD